MQTEIFSRDDLKRRILEDLNQPDLTPNQKKDLYNLYEKTTRFEIEQAKQDEEARLVEQMELGDALESVIKGDSEPLNKFFDIKVAKDGKVTFKLKKKSTQDLAYLSLLGKLERQNILDEFL